MEIIRMTDEQLNEMFPPPKSAGKSTEQEQIDDIKRSLSEISEVILPFVSLVKEEVSSGGGISSVYDLINKSTTEECADEHTGN